MAAKRFFYVSAGVLCLSVSAFLTQLQPNKVNATGVDPVHNVIATAGEYAINSAGEIYNYLEGGTGWYKIGDLPFPASQLHFATKSGVDFRLIDKSGNYWRYASPNSVNHGPVPGGTVPTSESTWGKIKSDFDKQD